MRVAIHSEGRLVGLNDLHHVQGIERRCERAPFYLELGLMSGAYYAGKLPD
jgi:hypothetical protein